MFCLKKLKKFNKNNFYEKIFKEFDVDIIVDSSKAIPWFVDAYKKINKKEVKIINILIYKEPIDYAYSMWKYNRLKNWDKYYKKYHKIYIRTFLNFISINFSRLINNPNIVLRQLCRVIGIEYFKEKESFWKNDTHHLFGIGFIRQVMKKHKYKEINYVFLKQVYSADFKKDHK